MNEVCGHGEICSDMRIHYYKLVVIMLQYEASCMLDVYMETNQGRG